MADHPSLRYTREEAMRIIRALAARVTPEHVDTVNRAAARYPEDATPLAEAGDVLDELRRIGPRLPLEEPAP